jgi:hypothetical protein
MGEISCFFPTDYRSTVNGYPYMRLKLGGFWMVSSSILENGVNTCGAKHPLNDQSLFDADGAPREPLGRRFDRPDAFISGPAALGPQRQRAEADRNAEGQQRYRCRRSRKQDDRAHEQAPTISAEAAQSGKRSSVHRRHNGANIMPLFALSVR